MGSFRIWHWLIIFLVLPLIFLPTIIALARDHPHKIAIILTNVLGGFLYGIGWLVALVWCFILPKNKRNIPAGLAEEIDRLYELKEKGALTQEEYDMKKHLILKD